MAAVLGQAADAVVADDFSAAGAAVTALKEADGGRAAIVLADWPDQARENSESLPGGARWAVDLIEAPPRLQGAMTAMLAGVAVVDDLVAALDLVTARPALRAVTLDGDLVGAGWVDGGSDRKPSTLEIASEIDKARNELEAAETQVAELNAALAGAVAEQASRQDAAEQALAALNESDAAIAAIYEQLGRLGQDARLAEDEWRRLLEQRAEMEAGRNQTVEELTALEARLLAAQQSQTVVDDSPGNRQQIQAAAEAARVVEVEARLAVRTAEERANAVRGGRIRCGVQRPPSVRPGSAPRGPRRAGTPPKLRRQSLRAAGGSPSASARWSRPPREPVIGWQPSGKPGLRRWQPRAGGRPAQRPHHRPDRFSAPRRSGQRRRRRCGSSSLSKWSSTSSEWPPTTLSPNTVPRWNCRPRSWKWLSTSRLASAASRSPPGAAAIRPGQPGRRAKRAERELAELGRVNPLALEEFAALEERYNFPVHPTRGTSKPPAEPP